MQLNTYATLSAFQQRQALAASDTGDDDRMPAKLPLDVSRLKTVSDLN